LPDNKDKENKNKDKENKRLTASDVFKK